MIAFLSGISVTCFVTSYLIALLLELTRSLRELPLRRGVILTFTVVGLALHLVYLILRAQPSGGQAGLLATWYDWSLLLAWGLAACYLWFLIQRPETTLGWLLLPPVLGLIVLAILVRDSAPFSREEATGIWRNIHALTMLVGTVAVLLGFLAGVMFLIQSRRLKHKRIGHGRMRLPTLEALQRLNRRCLYFSTTALGLGLVSGIVMNLNRWGYVGWSERGVIFSGVLLLWLLAATLFEVFYKPARRGRKVSYLTLASFGFLVLALAAVLTSPHGRDTALPQSTLPQSTLPKASSPPRAATAVQEVRS